MKRNKQRWARLSDWERSKLVQMERADKYGTSGYLPEGYGECSYCSYPTSGGGLCMYCLNEYSELIDKADDKTKKI